MKNDFRRPAPFHPKQNAAKAHPPTAEEQRQIDAAAAFKDFPKPKAPRRPGPSAGPWRCEWSEEDFEWKIYGPKEPDGFSEIIAPSVIRGDNAQLMTKAPELLALLRSIVADVEALRARPEIVAELRPEFDDVPKPSGSGWFGPLSPYSHDSYASDFFEWPNLALLIDKAKEVLK